ncbi:lysosomal acid phosphatase-like [Cimex lectularius]|uniref:acid phosphatase n=1 Tax=Cimex lectularius TaxID=79782 RepID=A0A8I6SBT9_CIMLE|nr:lysosomal acid phosphatase-like [Cimex lectularius]
MKIVTLFVIVCLMSVSLCLSVDPLDEHFGKVVFANILYRHGERNPTRTYSNDPYKNFWSDDDLAQLTNEGKLHHYKLGKWFRQRYNHLFPKDGYNHNTVYIRSTDVDRTLMSAQANAAGMFPLEQKDHWSDVNWQPIPIHTTPQKEDKALAMKAPCSKFEALFEKFKNSDYMKKLNWKYDLFFQYLSHNTGDNVTFFGVNYIYNTLIIENRTNLELPKWTKSVFPDILRKLSGISFSLTTHTTEMKRLKGGPVLKDMLESFQSKLNAQHFPRNITVYSAHDTTIVFLLNTLGVYDFIPPPFAAAVLVELRQNKNNEKFVTVLYKNSEAEPHLLTVPGCTKACPLDKFIYLLKPVIPTNWDEECKESID